MGKTSVDSRLNLPGRVAWILMEAPGFMTLLYMMKTLPQMHGIDDLPWQNRVLAGLFVSARRFFFFFTFGQVLFLPSSRPQVIHYTYRAIIFPLIQPSMSPIHILVALMAVGFQVLNGTCIGAWLAAYGPVTAEAWAEQSSTGQFVAGIAIFYIGLASNFFHDEELREIRRTEKRRQERILGERAGGKTVSVEKHYQVPQAGLFRYVLYAHYLCEWLEWTGFLMAAGWGCAPAWAFLTNEVCAMLPRAVKGKKWYIERFGEDKIRNKWAVLPGIV